MTNMAAAPAREQRFILKGEHHLTAMLKYIERVGGSTPLEVLVRPWSPKRSIDQNALFHVLYKQVTDQLEDRNGDDAQCESKLNCGVPILLRDDESFRDMWIANVRDGWSYEAKLVLMKWLPVTRTFSKKQGTEYIDRLCHYWAQAGVALELPGEY